MLVLLLLGFVAMAVALSFVASAIRIVREDERGVVFRLGLLLPQPKGPGLLLLLPFVDHLTRVKVSAQSIELPAADTTTRDNVPVKVNASVAFRVVNPVQAVVKVADYRDTLRQAVQRRLGGEVAGAEYDELVYRRQNLSDRLVKSLNAESTAWGLEVDRIELDAMRRFS